jgi:hypothetical protein
MGFGVGLGGTENLVSKGIRLPEFATQKYVSNTSFKVYITVPSSKKGISLNCTSQLCRLFTYLSGICSCNSYRSNTNDQTENITPSVPNWT